MLSADRTTAGFTVEDATNTIRFVRELAAPRTAVFAAWTEPEQLAQWWDATGEKLAACEIDLRPGGSFRFVTSHHPDKPFTGVYRKIAAPSLLVFEANGAIGRVVLGEGAGGTLMTVEIACSSADHLTQFLEMGIAAGTGRTLDNLARYVAAA